MNCQSRVRCPGENCAVTYWRWSGREENAGLWGALNYEMANSLAQNPQGPRAENLE